MCWYEYWSKKIVAKNNFGKKYFEFINNAVFGKNYGKCEKTLRY